MKNMRKIAGVLLALVMVFALAAPAFAAEADLSGHTYKAYQIFAGTQAKDNATLGNITWGSGINADAFLADLKADEKIGSVFAECETAADVAEVLTGWADKSENAEAFAKVAYDHIIASAGIDCVNGTTPLNAGYYLVVDVTDFEEGATNTVYNLALLQLTNKGTFEITNKTDVPEFEKKVKDINDTTDAGYSDWQDSADHDIGDDVPFQLKATLASNVNDYDTYKVVFHDTLSAGLTFNADSVKVYVDGNLVTSGYTLITDCDDNCTFEVVINDAKVIGAGNSSIITVEYTAELNENAVLGSKGNPNVAHLEYSNNPNWKGDGDNQPGTPGDEEPPTGETPEDKVIVFTFKVVVNKVDENNAALAGAGFTLFKLDKETGEYIKIGSELTGDQMTQFVWKGLDDGDYKLVETTTPAGYNTIDDIYFTITAEHEILSDNPTLTKLEGGDMFTGDVSTGALTGDVINKSGVELPETGGIGTTIFYTMGAMLALGAAVLLITKKRMGVAE